MPDRFGAVAAAVCAAGVVAGVVALGAANPPTPLPVSTDRLGPDAGEQVADYLARAGDTLDTGDGADPRWGLVSFDHEVTAAEADALTADVRVSQLWFRVPIDRVQTPIVPVGVAGAESIARASGLAAVQLRGTTGEWDRQAQVDAVSALRLGQNCACVVAATVRGPLSEVAELEGVDGVRVVEVLPSDAVFGRFAVRPLLPEQTDAVTPGPDDGEVPSR
ncbi:hypothetical protein [Rhodococcus gannanensis]|uniref:Uncharacterized protein n=1 Tax=Rhodococcus gannanensis TaxID=1960308 RepID=A0ABW4P5S2_9NOCA